ncbi:glutathione ABC transporter substrate-binding protein [Heyndrickxia ginsengihumi]|uniref:glutathione ABC transporter substrate-binding protein n=1 Tax=Heyndrickxia ginsengihumi TaxID=363870 RepID=UPI0004726924|nr:glutathione ABC transporter substrate-binding protein [Heyndrickxia ginsengihumi]
MKKLLVIFATLLLALAGGCSSSTSGSSSNGGNVKQEITYATTSDVAGLSPIMTNDNVSAHVTSQIFETLFVRDPKTMKIKPLLAKSYSTPNKTTWVIKLRKGIKFQDGTDFNAEAVKYTFDKIKDPKTAAPRASLLEPIKETKVIDDYTVQITTKYPYGPMLAALSHTNAAIVSPTADKKQDLNKKPVGTGPFKFVKWVPGEEVVLEKNKNYWKGAPKLDKVTFKVVPDVNTAISMLQTGDVQFIDNIPSEQIKRVEKIQDVAVSKQTATPVYYLAFNMKKGPMKDLAFRQAVAYALNREAYVKKLNGLGIGGNSIIGPKVFGYDAASNKVGYSYNPTKAKELIKKNGYSGKTINLLVANTASYEQMAEIVQSQLKAVGINAKIQTMEWASFLDTARKGQFDMTFLGWTNSTGDGSELLYPNFHSDNIGSSNYLSYDNKKFDKLVDESRQSIDTSVRKEKLKEANELLIKDAPAIVMNHGVVSVAYNKSVNGLVIDPTGQWSLYPVSRK